MWLYVPETSSLSAPASAGSSLASPSPCTIGGRLHAASATWRGKPQPPQAWSRRWKRDGFIRRLSGPTLPLSTLDAGVDAFISSLRATPARTTASPDSVPEPKGSGSSPLRSFASPPSAGLIVSSARTCRGTSPSSSPPSSGHWMGWATALRQEFSARAKPATPCSASEPSSWPAPAVMDTGGGNGPRQDPVAAREAQGAWDQRQRLRYVAGRSGTNVARSQCGDGDARPDAAGLPFGEGPDDISGRSGEPLAGTGSAGSQGCEFGRASDGQLGLAASRPAAELRGARLPPAVIPGPADTRRWIDVLDRWPELQPALSEEEAESHLRRGIDAMADRVERLRATGNGVDPVVAAYAYLSLDALLERSPAAGRYV